MTSTGSSTPSRYVDENGVTDAEAYLTDIYDGREVASANMRRLSEILLPRFHEEYHGFHYDVDKALRPVQFIERFCVIPEGDKMWQPFVMERFQRACIELAYGFVDENLLRQFQQVVFELGRKNGKALGVDTEVATPSGWRRIADIHTGDRVFGQDGRPSTVIAESDVFYDKPVLLVTFEDGSKVKATGDHVWTVVGKGKTLEYAVLSGDARDMTTEEMLDGFEPGRYHVPLCKPVEYPAARLEAHPYDVGRSIMGRRGATLPDAYLTASVSQRMAVASGIEDECRSVGITSPVFETRELSERVAELYASIGVFTVTHEHAGCFYVSVDRTLRTKSIVSIERVPDEPTKCIAIDNPSHLYLVGRSYTATHNTSLISGLGLFHLMGDGEMGAEVYCCATTEPQARKALGAADSMAFHSAMLSKRIRRGISQKTGRSALNYDVTGSMLAALSSAPLRGKDGLSCSALIYDELAAVEDNGALLDNIEESMSARRQPMTWILSSENYIRDGIWDERIEYCHGVLDGSIEDDRVLPLLYTQDDQREIVEGLNDERHTVWLKSNPGLFKIKDADRLVQRVRQAQQSPRRLPSVITKEFCLRSGSYSAFLNPADCINNTPIDFDAIGVPPYVCIGLDLAVRYDLCSCVARWKVPGDDRIYEIAKFWIASAMMNTQTDAKQKDRVPYLFWSSQGQKFGDTTWHYVDIVEGDRVGIQCAIDFMSDLVNEGMYPYCIGYDSWHVGDLEQDKLRRFVGESRTLPVPPTMKAISPLVREHELDLKAHRVICPNPCLHHNRESVQVRVDPQENVQVQKKDLQPHQKIDGFMAELYSLAAFNKFKDGYLSSIGWVPPEGDALVES